MYDEHVKKITDELNQLKRRHVELISLVQDVVSIILIQQIHFYLWDIDFFYILWIRVNHEYKVQLITQLL